MAKRILLALFWALTLPLYSQVVISEIRIDQTGADNDEYFEICNKGTSAVDLTNHSYIVLGDNSGEIEEITNLSGIIPAGDCWIWSESTFTLGASCNNTISSLNFENSDNVTHLLVTDLTGTLGQDLDSDDNCILDVMPWTTIVDGVALVETVGSGDCNYMGAAITSIGPDGTLVPSHVYRDASCNWNIGQFDPLGGDDNPCSLGPPTCNALDEWIFEILPCTEMTIAGTYTVRVVLDSIVMLDSSALFPMASSMMAGVDSVEYTLGPIPSGSDYYLRFVGTDCVDTLIYQGNVNCDVCSQTILDPEFSYPADLFCAFNTTISPTHTTGSDGRYAYVPLSGGPILDIDPLSGVIQSGNSDAGVYEISNTVQGCGRMVISGIIDGDLTGGLPKGIEFYVLADIDNLSQYSFGSANNGGGTDGEEFTFPQMFVPAGTYLYLTTDESSFSSFLGVDPDFVHFSANINGDDALELFCGGALIDLYGDQNISGTGQAWEYTDSWSYRNINQGPNFGVFNPSNWTIAGPDALDGETLNTTAATPFPLGTYSQVGFVPLCTDTSFVDSLELLEVSATENACQDEVYLSLDSDCTVEVTSGMLISGERHLCFDLFTVTIVDPYGKEIGNIITERNRGQKLTYRVNSGDQSCWGHLIVEDKLPPQIVCRDTAISCLQPFADDYLFLDNCGYEPQVEILGNNWNELPCGSDTAGYYSRRIFVSDVWGNSNECFQNIYIFQETLDSLECPEETIIDCCNPKLKSFLTSTFDEQGRAHPIPYYIAGINIGLVDPPFINGFPITEVGDKCNINTTYKDHVLENCGKTYKIRREWKIYDWCEGTDTTCIQYIKIVDTLGPSVESLNPQTVYVQPHECKGHVELEFPWINKECSSDDVLKVFYNIQYVDAQLNIHALTGEILFGSFATVYLPVGDYEVEYRVVDECWNETYAYQQIWVIDNLPPTPVCDEITQVTLDPERCWVRIYGEDLDDGSHDNCSEPLHFAVASMSDINKYTDRFTDSIIHCVGEYNFNLHKHYYDQFIEYLINCFVFDDYVDLEECGLDSLVLRVFEASGMPLFDPHKFKGSKHSWYCFNQYDDFACRYLIQFSDIDEYNPVRPFLTCYKDRLDHEDLGFGCSFLGRNNYKKVRGLSYQFVSDSPQLIGSGEDTSFTLILDNPIPIYGIPYSVIKVATNGYISTDLGDDGSDASNDCLLPKTFSSGGGDRLYVLHSGDFGSEIGYEYLHSSPYAHPNGARIGVHVISWFTNIGIQFQALIFDNGDIIYQYSGIEGVSKYTIGAQTLKGDYYTNIGCNGSISLSAPTAIGLSSWGSEIKYSPICIQPYQPGKNDLWCDFQIDEEHPYHEKWQTIFNEYPHLDHLIRHRKQFPSLYNDCMIIVKKDDKTPPVCYAPDPVTYYCDGVPEHGSFYPNNGNDKLEWWVARFAHDICEDPDIWNSACEWDRTDDDSDTYEAPNEYCVIPGWNNIHGFYMGPSSDSYSYDDPCNDHLLDWYPDSPDSYGDWKPIYCRFWLMLDIYDDEGYGKPDPYQYFGTPEYHDNCWYPDIDSTTEGTLDECGVGYLTRTWTVTDKCGSSSTCYQTITLKPRSDFEVKFPADVMVNCDDVDNLDPDENDPETYPQVTDDDCELIGVTYADQVIDPDGYRDEDGCYKILRTWKIIDWCVYLPEIHNRYPDIIVDDRCVAHEEDRPCVYRQLKDDGDGFMTYLQVIKVIDDVAPEVVCNPDSLFCIYDEECEDLYVEYDLGSATDNCTQELQYRYTINPNGDSPEADWIFGHGYTLQNTLPVGKHTVTLYAKDDCGNEGYCELMVEVKDCKPPTPYCYNGIATVVMPSTGEVTVWARDLDAGSFDNCTEEDSLRFTFTDTHPDEDETYSADDLSSSMVFTCDDLGQVPVNIYVWDEADNVDFCETFLLIQPGSYACNTSESGHVIDESKISKEIDQHKKVNTVGLDGFASSLSYQSMQHPTLYQNHPNPFKQVTTISFVMPSSQHAVLTITNMNGQSIKSYERLYPKGLNDLLINELTQPGIYFYSLKYAKGTITKKMILIN